MANEAAPPSPQFIFETLNAFQRTATLKTAIELDLFSHLAAGATTTASLARASAASERGVRMVCDALCVLGFLRKAAGVYSLTAESAFFLDRKSPAYLGSAADFLTAPHNVEAFAQLTQAVRQGGTALPGKGAVEDNFPGWVAFARGMAPLMIPTAAALAALLCPGEPRPLRVLDIAAGHGMYGIQVAMRNPLAQVYAVDWPPVLAVAAENAARAGVGERLHPLPGSAFAVDFGAGYDLILLPNFLHHFSVAVCQDLLRKVGAALAPGGRVGVVEFVVSDDRLSPPPAALFPLIMLASTPEGDAYTYGEIDAMFHAAGFANTALHPLPPGFQSAVVAER